MEAIVMELLLPIQASRDKEVILPVFEELGLQIHGRTERGRRVDHAEHGKLANGTAGHEDSLGVGAGIGRSQQKPSSVYQGTIVACYPIEFVSVVQKDAQPQACYAGASGKPAAEETLWIGGILIGELARKMACAACCRKFANVADPFDVIPCDPKEFSGGIEQFEVSGLYGFCDRIGRGVSGAPVPGQLAHDHGFTGDTHWVDCRTSWDLEPHPARSDVAKLVTV
jgi:hypothetical protein